MGAFGKTLAAGTLAFGALGSGFAGNYGSNGWNSPHQSTYKHDGGKSKHSSYDNKDWNKGKSFYELSWDDQHKLCSDDHYWNMWSQKTNANYWDRGNYCQDHKDKKDHSNWKDYGSKDQYGYGKQADWNKHDQKDYKDWKDDGHKSYGLKDWNNDDWCDDYNQKTAYSKNVEASKSYSAKTEKHEKQAFVLEANSNRQHNDYDHDYDKGGKHYGYDQYDHGDKSKDDWGKDYGKNDYDWSKDYGKGHDDYDKDRKHDYSSDNSSVQLYAVEQKDAQASVKSDTTQATVINNYNYINGDNNVINNNITVANTASTEQKASVSQSSQAELNYNNSSQNDYGKGGHDWGKGYSDSSDESFKLAASNEKSESSDVKQSSSYKLDESYSQDSDHGKNYGHDDQKDCQYAQSKYDDSCED